MNFDRIVLLFKALNPHSEAKSGFLLDSVVHKLTEVNSHDLVLSGKALSLFTRDVDAKIGTSSI